ncbi:hypothetical protein NL676_030848 [Syzygium grande]|nr:hypothetical protein NL676_030848 [Syzygium grande]
MKKKRRSGGGSNVGKPHRTSWPPPPPCTRGSSRLRRRAMASSGTTWPCHQEETISEASRRAKPPDPIPSSRARAMSLLDHLWDDTVAGPTPESGLGKLRKHGTFSSRSNSGKELEAASARSYGGGGGGGDAPLEATRKVTRSITIVRPPGYQSGSPPASPAGSATPGSPFSESPFGSGEDLRRMRMRRQAKLDQKAPLLFKSSDI